MNYPNKCDYNQKNEKNLHIGLLNLMPNKEKTNQQWANVFENAAEIVNWKYFGLESHRPKSQESIIFARDSDRIKEETISQLDFLVVTGAPVEKLPFEEVYYWEELSAALQLVVSKKIPILAVCWGAQALLYLRKNVAKELYEEKVTGIFSHYGMSIFHELGTFGMPHSRYTGWKQETLESIHGIEPVLCRSEGEWVGLLDEVGNLYISGHPEYDEETLVLEYKRDFQKGFFNTRPKGYTFTEDKAVLESSKWDTVVRKMIKLWIQND